MAGTSLGTAYVQIVPKADGIKGSITEALGGEAESAGTNAGNKIASFVKKALIGGAIGKVLKDTIQEGARYEQARGGIETLFGAKGANSVQEYAKMVKKSVSEVQGEYTRLKGVEDTMMKNANNAWKTAGLSANEYMEQSTSFAASLLQSVGGNQAKAAEAANAAVIAMSDNANKMGTNIQDIQNAYQGFAKQNYTMLDNLKLGYGGTKTEMERLLADAEELTGIHYDIDNLSDVYSAISVIQDELGITGTTALEAEKTISGSFASMKSAVSNFMAQLVVGEDLSGAMEGVMDSVLIFGKNLVKAFGNILLNLPDALGHLGDLIINKITEFGDDPSIGNAAGEFIKTFALGLIKNLPKLLAAAAGIVGYLISVIGQAAGHLLKAGATAIASWASGMWQGFKAKVVAVLGNIKTSVSSKFDSIKTAISSKAAAAISAVKAKFAAAKAAMIQPFEAAKTKIKSLVDKIKSIVNGAKLKLPKIKLPHFSITGKLKLNPPSVPKISISWYKKGGIFDSPTIAGIGEAGPEAVVPLDTLWKKLDRIAAASASNNGGTTINVYGSPGMDVNELAEVVERKLAIKQKQRTMAWV